MSLLQRGCFIILVITLSFFSIAYGHEHLSKDPEVVRARALVETGQFEAALHILLNLSPNHSDAIDVDFLIGLATTRLSQTSGIDETIKTALLTEAIAAFSRILDEQPGLVRVRLELARAYFLLGNDGKSRQHFERVLAGAPSEAVAYNIQRHLDSIWTRRAWQGYFGINLAADSNINQASSDSVIVLYGVPFHVNNDARSGTGIVVSNGGEYQHELAESARLRTGIDFSFKDFAGRVFDQAAIATHWGPLWKVNERWEFSVLGSTLHQWVGTNPYSKALGLKFETNYALDPRTKLRGNLAWNQRKINRRPLLDGSYTNADMAVEWLMSPTAQVGISLAYGIERPKSNVWKNNSTGLKTYLSVLLPGSYTLGASIAIERIKYRGRWTQYTTGGVSRRDRVRVIRIHAQKRNIKIFGFVPQATVVNEVRKSNAALYDYRRSRLEVALQREF